MRNILCLGFRTVLMLEIQFQTLDNELQSEKTNFKIILSSK